ncbi:MAG: heavy metal sensor histidine kinase [Gammaproteobacteria bacterium]
MFWKTVKIPQVDHLLPKHPRQWSITLRLAWIYALSALCVLIITTFSLYWIFTGRLDKENYQFLENKVLVLQKLMQTQSQSASALKEEIMLEPALYHYYSRIIDKSGKVLIETPKMKDTAPVAAFADITPQAIGPFQTLAWRAHKIHHQKRKYFLLMSAQVDNSSDRIIQIAKDITTERDIINDYRQDLLIVLLIGVIGSSILGWIVARKGLQPLREITQSTQQVTVVQLKKRLNPTSWPKELSILANAFNHMLDRIEEGVNRLSQFSDDLAHDLRTPINNLIGEAEIILSRPRSNEEYKNVIESSLEEYLRISQMIESLLFLASAENPETVINPVVLSVQKLFEEVREFYDAAAEEQGINIICQGKEYVTADPILLRRALSNLVSNALRYTANGGTIILSDKKKDRQIAISISDNGEGIAKEHIPHLFSRFYRADKARSQRAGGTGLGLAIVKSIMDLHQGRALIDSEIGKGTTITLIFPS